jgi:hypothetical protein
MLDMIITKNTGIKSPMIDLLRYKNTGGGSPVYIHIPISELKSVQSSLRGMGYRYVFRGKRNRGEDFTRKANAWGFTVYRRFGY